MKDLKHKKPNMIDRACARVAEGPTDPAIKQSWDYINAVLASTGRIIYICTLGLLLAVLRGIDSGLTAFCREIGRDCGTSDK